MANFDASMRRRTLNEIAAEIIRVCDGGTKKTRIMYTSMLNLRQINRYLKLLVGQGLLAFDHNLKTYSATKKGQLYLRTFEEFSNLKTVFRNQQATLSNLLRIPASARKV